MAKFYIHFRYRDKIDKDYEGIDLPTLAEAREAALLSLRELLAENIHADSKTPVESARRSKECQYLPAFFGPTPPVWGSTSLP
jgi:hypothetical protein